jgi:hypothetical protein
MTIYTEVSFLWPTDCYQGFTNWPRTVASETRGASPAAVETMPSSWIIAECPLCGVRRYYLLADIFRGKLSFKVMR